MLKPEAFIVIARAAEQGVSRRMAWDAIARAWGVDAQFVVNPTLPVDREAVRFAWSQRTLLVPLTASENHAVVRPRERDRATLRNCINDACGAVVSSDGTLALNADPVGLLASLIDLEEEPVTVLRDHFGLVEARSGWRSPEELLVPVLERVSAVLGELVNVPARPAAFPGGKSWAIGFSSDLDVLEDDHLDRVMNILDRHGVERPTFMICAVDKAERTIRDVHYDIMDAGISRITEPLRRSDVEIGLHGSYLAHDRVDWLVRQKTRVEQVFEQRVRGHRAHFLRFARSRSWLAQEQAGFEYDASLAYADLPGFRNGCASPIEYRLPGDKRIRVFSTPFIDQHFFWPSRVSDQVFQSTVDPLLAELGERGGVLTLDWHSYTIRGDDSNGWWARLEYILDNARRAGAYLGGLASVSDAYFGQQGWRDGDRPSTASDWAVAEPGHTVTEPTTTNRADVQNLSSRASVDAASESYFESGDVWVDRPEPYQTQLRALLLALLGRDRISVLDVGCGNGLITNFLPANVEVTGVDLSATALRHVRVAKKQGSITALPFADQSFDFVYCFDVLEHLTDGDMRIALQELQRVARKQVLVAVPLNEDIAANSVNCAHCGCTYHINGHLRSHDIAWLERLPISDDYERTAVFLSGDVTVPPANPLIDLYGRCGIYPQLTHMSCPRCGVQEVSRQTFSDLPFDLKRVANSLRSAEWSKQLRCLGPWCDRSEGLTLLTRKGQHSVLPAATAQLSKLASLEVDFSNHLQAVSSDFVPGSVWPRFKPGRGVMLVDAALQLIDGGKHQSSPTMVRLPILPQAGDMIALDVSCAEEGAISLFGIDGISGAIVRLLVDHAPGACEMLRLRVPVSAAWSMDRFGLAIDVYLYGTIRLHRIAYLTESRLPDMQAVHVEPGFNLLQLPSTGALPTYWSFDTTMGGRLPVSSTRKVDMYAAARSMSKLFVAGHRKVTLDVDALAGLGQIEVRMAELEQALARTDTEIEALRAEAAQAKHVTILQPARRFAGRVFRYAKRKVRGLRSWVGRLVFADSRLDTDQALNLPARWTPVEAQELGIGPDARRLLLISHMFPHPDQPGLGSFVLEQAQALRRSGIDARVVSGRPFWLTGHRSPLRLLGGLYNYVRLYAAARNRWWSVDDVPVRFLPYPVLGPFWSHGWTYRFAIGRNWSQLKDEFDPEILHAHTGYLDGSAARALSTRLNLPYLITEHTGPFSMLMSNTTVRRTTLGSMRDAVRVVTVSTALQREVASYLSLPPEATQVIPNVLDAGQFHLADRWEPQPLAPRILFVGYFSPVKNLPLLLAAFQQVLAVKPGARLKLVGGGEVPQQQVDLIRRIAEMGLSGAVAVAGYKDRTEIARIMREECDLLVLPSKSETFGCVVAEALATGKPAVVTPCGGPQDIVVAPWQGEVCERNHDAPALAASILAVVDRLPTFDPQRIRASAIDRFSSDAVALRLSALYNEVLVDVTERAKAFS